MIESEKYESLAIKYFKEGYNCTQAIVLAFKDFIPVDEKILLKLVSPFGGGVSRLRQMCGAMSGVCFILGHYYGYYDASNYLQKKQLYEKIQDVANRFKTMNGSYICKELLNLKEEKSSYIPEIRTEQYYKKRPCIQIIQNAAKLVVEEINNYEKISN